MSCRRGCGPCGKGSCRRAGQGTHRTAVLRGWPPGSPVDLTDSSTEWPSASSDAGAARGPGHGLRPCHGAVGPCEGSLGCATHHRRGMWGSQPEPRQVHHRYSAKFPSCSRKCALVPYVAESGNVSRCPCVRVCARGITIKTKCYNVICYLLSRWHRLSFRGAGGEVGEPRGRSTSAGG
jgi:hypothetical protein